MAALEPWSSLWKYIETAARYTHQGFLATASEILLSFVETCLAYSRPVLSRDTHGILDSKDSSQ